jgi:5'-phosphate synthase pdxT subunit
MFKFPDQTVGIVAIQGDYEKHRHAVEACGAAARYVKVPEDLEGCGRVIIPGGESTTVGQLMQRFGLADALIERVAAGLPVWGTCMGMIMMAKEIESRPDQFSLGILDVSVRRNAFGPQVHSFEAPVKVNGLPKPIMAVFIRAPIVTRVGPGVNVIAEVEGQVIAVRQGNLLGTSFHPELTDDRHMHQWFLSI